MRWNGKCSILTESNKSFFEELNMGEWVIQLGKWKSTSKKRYKKKNSAVANITWTFFQINIIQKKKASEQKRIWENERNHFVYGQSLMIYFDRVNNFSWFMLTRTKGTGRYEKVAQAENDLPTVMIFPYALWWWSNLYLQSLNKQLFGHLGTVFSNESKAMQYLIQLSQLFSIFIRSTNLNELISNANSSIYWMNNTIKKKLNAKKKTVFFAYIEASSSFENRKSFLLHSYEKNEICIWNMIFRLHNIYNIVTLEKQK